VVSTDGGERAKTLAPPVFGGGREAAGRVPGALGEEGRARLLEGVALDDGTAAFGSIEDGGGEGVNCWYRVTISEGRNREVRRMFEAVGHAVSRLIRIRYGAMVLPRGLARGTWMELDAADIAALMRAAGVQARPPAAPRGDGAARRARPGKDNARGWSQGPRDASREPGRSAKGAGARQGQRTAGSGQPDPLKTSLGHIGSDRLQRHRPAPRRGGRRQGAPRGGPWGPGRVSSSE